MKKCPTCNRTYEGDAFAHCPADGSPLSVLPDDPAATWPTAPPPAYQGRISTGHFRILLVVSFVLDFASVGLHLVTLHLLPVPLRLYLASEADSPTTEADIFIGAIGVLLVLLFLAVWIGLFLLKRWARGVLPFLLVVSALAAALFGPTVEFGLVSSLSGLVAVVNGVILALAFFSPVSEHFEPRRAKV